MNAAEKYHEHARGLVDRIMATQSAAIRKAALLVADTVERDGLVYTLGSGHSLLTAAEFYYRAGGLANFDVVHDKTFGRAERLSGYAAVLLESYPISSNDLLFIVSNSGRNALPVEMAIEARKRGVTTVAITSLEHSRSVSPRAPSGQRLFEICDLVIDNCGVMGDAAVAVGNGSGMTVGPTSTLAGVFIANCVVGLAVEELLRRGVRPPLFRSANVDGADAENERLLSFLRERVRGL
ncbi:MAG TPA: SIS domain-containing protein [Bryobacteraceae bacterium]|nr:SIS domain-containing protein [Bryobacteraceae bacterium]